MAASSDYWNISDAVQSQLVELSTLGIDMHRNLEANDDPAELADALDEIKKRLVKLSEQIGPNVAPLRKVATALKSLPGIR